MDNVESNTGILVGMVCFTTVFKRFVVKEECCMGVVGLTLGYSVNAVFNRFWYVYPP